MSYTADSIRDSIRIRIVTPDSIRIRFERKRPIRRSLFGTQQFNDYYRVTGNKRALVLLDRPSDAIAS